MENPSVRQPLVAGHFYSSSAQRLRKEIEILIGTKKPTPRDVIAAMMPHAGYMYSGEVAAVTASRINIKNRIILLGPKHTDEGEPFSIMTEGVWQMPFGAIEVDSELASAILSDSKVLDDDPIAHVNEHSLEVELPFLSYFKPDYKIVPIVVSVDDLRVYRQIGREIADAVKKLGIEKDTLIIASSDMTHYEPQDSAQMKDKEALEAVLKLDDAKLVDTVERLNISMCGYAPTTIMLAAAKYLGAKQAELVRYQTSGDITGDYSSVVGYAGVIVY
ncbi:MAG: AmmeMemoRadiSam system protein B [Candidatus Omnitrophica bacterium]|nr:AmmeMemoRadiSam system protein B [Candidatus Omnitrophota bacterium]